MIPPRDRVRSCIANGVAIRRLRTDKGWTGEDLASESSLSLRTIVSLEKGQRASPHTLKMCADALGVDVKEIIKREGERSYPRDRTVTISVNFTLHFERTDLAEPFIRLLTDLVEQAKVCNQVDVGPVYDGSLNVYLYMDLEDGIRLTAFLLYSMNEKSPSPIAGNPTLSKAQSFPSHTSGRPQPNDNQFVTSLVRLTLGEIDHADTLARHYFQFNAARWKQIIEEVIAN